MYEWLCLLKLWYLCTQSLMNVEHKFLNSFSTISSCSCSIALVLIISHHLESLPLSSLKVDTEYNVNLFTFSLIFSSGVNNSHIEYFRVIYESSLFFIYINKRNTCFYFIYEVMFQILGIISGAPLQEPCNVA